MIVRKTGPQDHSEKLLWTVRIDVLWLKMEQLPDVVSSTNTAIAGRFNDWQRAIKNIKSPQQVFDEKHEELKGRIRAEASDSVARQANPDDDWLQNIIRLSGDLREFENSHKKTLAEQDLIYQRSLWPHLEELTDEFVRILGRSTVERSLRKLPSPEKSPSSTVAGSDIPVDSTTSEAAALETVTQETTPPPSEKQGHADDSAQSTLQENPINDDMVIIDNAPPDRDPDTATEIVVEHPADSQTHEKRKAPTAASEASPNKRPRTDEIHAVAGEEQPVVVSQERTIRFEEIFQNGDASEKCEIVRFPPKTGPWYILRCDEHEKHFTRRPLFIAKRHRTTHHPHLSKPKQGDADGVAVDEFGIRVLECDEELVEENNEIADLAYTEKRDQPLGRRGSQMNGRSKGQGAPRTSSTSGADDDFSPTTAGTSPFPHRELRATSGITNPLVGRIYKAYWEGHKTFFAVLILPNGDFTDLGIEGTIWNKHLAKHAPPPCYLYDPETKTFDGWADGYEDGGAWVKDRAFPAMYFDGPEFPTPTSVGWVYAKDLSDYSALDTSIKYQKPVAKFSEQRPAVLAMDASLGNNNEADGMSANVASETGRPSLAPVHSARGDLPAKTGHPQTTDAANGFTPSNKDQNKKPGASVLAYAEDESTAMGSPNHGNENLSPRSRSFESPAFFLESSPDDPLPHATEQNTLEMQEKFENSRRLALEGLQLQEAMAAGEAQGSAFAAEELDLHAELAAMNSQSKSETQPDLVAITKPPQSGSIVTASRTGSISVASDAEVSPRQAPKPAPAPAPAPAPMPASASTPASQKPVPSPLGPGQHPPTPKLSQTDGKMAGPVTRPASVPQAQVSDRPEDRKETMALQNSAIREAPYYAQKVVHQHSFGSQAKFPIDSSPANTSTIKVGTQPADTVPRRDSLAAQPAHAARRNSDLPSISAEARPAVVSPSKRPNNYIASMVESMPHPDVVARGSQLNAPGRPVPAPHPSGHYVTPNGDSSRPLSGYHVTGAAPMEAPRGDTNRGQPSDQHHPPAREQQSPQSKEPQHPPPREHQHSQPREQQPNLHHQHPQAREQQQNSQSREPQHPAPREPQHSQHREQQRSGYYQQAHPLGAAQPMGNSSNAPCPDYMRMPHSPAANGTFSPGAVTNGPQQYAKGPQYFTQGRV